MITKNIITKLNIKDDWQWLPKRVGAGAFLVQKHVLQGKTLMPCRLIVFR